MFDVIALIASFLTIWLSGKLFGKSTILIILLGTVYTDAVSFVTASVSMRLRLSFTRRRSSSLSEPGRFENAFKSGAFSKRYGFIGRVNGETASI